ncbi:RING finger protein 212B-like isoform X1 [Polypterus senegalus]|uniref:RING finger protein 212B-like isoform X1 n=2 Tax=Polypterus senegalus TaxID=55291 RepID=UPI001964AC69|nr:RING finger protein 212B-like isoform X1 [Polypterus senegalus]XP_039603721.1 RING finger protein 212B-like isoform X1 [Polypterus senegalus]XP_039603731.1 RING finger protein 212B-like isoform X1 [Polypterus senegalus]
MMDWFHCNKCFKTEGNTFYVSSCSHICCEACISKDICCICGTACRYLQLSNNLKTQERVYFMNPVEMGKKQFEKITQVSIFQRQQIDRVLTFFKQKSSKLEAKLTEVCKHNCHLERQLEDLKKENCELRVILSQNKMSASVLESGRFSKILKPIAITSPTPVTPIRSSYQVSRSYSEESLERHFQNRPTNMQTPGSSMLSGSSSTYDLRTPNTVSGRDANFGMSPSVNLLAFDMISRLQQRRE